MPIPVLMPALSPTMEEGTLSKWNVSEGDTVSSGDVIAEIETDKATMEVEAVDDGVIGKLLVAAGTENVKVNEPIAVIVDDGESADDLDLSTVSAANGAAAPAVSETPVSEPTVTNAAPAQVVNTPASDPELPVSYTHLTLPTNREV